MHRLAGLIDRIERGEPALDHGSRGADGLPTGWPGVAAVLARGALHEWFAMTDDREGASATRATASPPLLILAHLALQSLRTAEGAASKRILWVGRHVWPHPSTLVRDDDRHASLRQSLFIDPPDAAVRLWAIDLALRCPAVAAVVADGRGLDMAATRRLQLAAERGGALALIVREPHEHKDLTAASTRWQVSRVRSPCDTPRWMVRLVRCKGVQRWATATEADSRWLLEWSRAEGAVHPPADVADRSDSPPSATTTSSPIAAIAG